MALHHSYHIGGGRVTYSTSEQVVGEWLDGRPLYQKTIDFGTLPNNATKEVSTNIDNPDRVWVYDGYYYNPNNGWCNQLNLPNKTSASQIYFATNAYGTKINCWAGSNRTAYTECYVTLRYTKTTD